MPEQPPAVGDAGNTREIAAAAAHRFDTLARMTRLLLEEYSLSEPVALRRATELLAAEHADWVIIDVVRGSAMERSAVAGPEDRDGIRGVRLLETLDPGACELPRDVLKSGTPVVYTPVEEDTGLGVSLDGVPVLTALEIGSTICVPLRDRRENLGALTLVQRADRPRFDGHDLELLEEIGHAIALALRAERKYRRRSNAVHALQASLLPRVLPAPAGLEIDVAYHTASEESEVGGDFYDVFEHRDGWALVVGDVCGKGEDAATATASVRHGVRLLSLWNTEPAETLRQVNQAMVARHETGRFVTVAAAYLSWSQGGARVRLASAGHPPAAVLRTDGDVQFATAGGMPLGIFQDVTVTTEDVCLLPGDVLLLYSDGATEARRPDGALYGHQRLADVLARMRGVPVSALVEAVENDLQEYTDGRTHDDVALLATRVQSVPG